MLFCITFSHFADAFIQSDLQLWTTKQFFLKRQTDTGNREFPNWPGNTEGGERRVRTAPGKKFVVDKGGGDHKKETEGGKGGMGT